MGDVAAAVARTGPFGVLSTFCILVIYDIAVHGADHGHIINMSLVKVVMALVAAISCILFGFVALESSMKRRGWLGVVIFLATLLIFAQLTEAVSQFCRDSCVQFAGELEDSLQKSLATMANMLHSGIAANGDCV